MSCKTYSNVDFICYNDKGGSELNTLIGYEYFTAADTGKTFAVSDRTGEAYETVTLTLPAGSQIITPEQRQANARKREQQREYLMAQSQNRQLGQFFFVATTHRYEDLSPETVGRLIYLASYQKYNCGGHLYLTQRTPIRHSDLPKVLGLSRSTTERFWREAHPAYIGQTKDGLLAVNEDIFFRGALGRRQGRSWRKIYRRNIQSLYRNAPPAKHRYLGYIFQLLPHLNTEYNILCYNASEREIGSIVTMNSEGFCDEIGYSYSAVSRLQKGFAELRLQTETTIEPFCSFYGTGSDTKIYVNPHIVYSGTNLYTAEYLGGFGVEAVPLDNFEQGGAAQTEEKSG